MQNLGDKLSEVQTQVSRLMGSMRRSLQEAVEFVSGALDEATEDDEEHMRRFERAISPLRGLASRGRQSLRNLSQRSRQRFSLRRHTTTPNSSSGELKDCDEEDEDEDPRIRESESPDETNITDDDPSTENKVSQALFRLTSQVKRRNTSTDSDTPDTFEPDPLLFPESSAPLLDSSVLRSKVDLGKKRSITRSRPSRAVRQRAALPALTEGLNPDWRFCDSTDAKAQCSNGQESESEEEPSTRATPPPAHSQPKRVPMFPGMDQSALMAQLKRRSVVTETETTEGQTPPVLPARSPRSSVLGPRVLPPADGSSSSPSWLLELKSKKRSSQPESDV